MPDIYADIMARDATEIQRMDNQFRLITGALGWTIHPSISAKLPKSPAIADFATGTGLFLRSVSEDHTNARLDGYDISSAMFPPESERKSNVKLYVLNAKESLPTELHGVYDLINVRYLIAGMDPEDWGQLLKNLLRGLKPGGALQWTEPAISRTQILRGRPDSSTVALRQFNYMFRSPTMERRFESGWSILPGLMEEAGLAVEIDVVSCDRVADNRKALAENGIVALTAAAHKMAAAGMPGALEVSKIDELEAMARQDIESGAYPQYSLHTAVGFKP